MPRTRRCNHPGTVHHLISRFVEQKWFIAGDEERECYLRLLASAMSESDWKCLAYAVMSNHIHFAMLAGEESLASWARAVHSPFAEWINKRNERVGPVFARGPSDYAVEPAGVGTLIAYIHNNPVRAGVAKRARDSSWTSHRAYLGQATTPDWLDVETGRLLSGFVDPLELDQWTNTSPEHRPALGLSPVYGQARKRGTLELGTPTVRSGEATVEVPLLGPSWTHVRVDPADLIEATASELELGRNTLCSRGRTEPILRARRVAVRAGYELGLIGADIAPALGISAQAVYAIRDRSRDSETRALATRVIERVVRQGC
jgi:hypothetical protein